MSNVAQLAAMIGKTVAVEFGDVGVVCVVKDVKTAYGRERLQVQPLIGYGEVWIESWRAQDVDAAKLQEMTAPGVKRG